MCVCVWCSMYLWCVCVAIALSTHLLCRACDGGCVETSMLQSPPCVRHPFKGRDQVRGGGREEWDHNSGVR